MNIFRKIFGRKDNAAPVKPSEPEPAVRMKEKAGPGLSQWYTFGAHLYRRADDVLEVVFTNEQKGVTRVIVDNEGFILNFPGVDNQAADAVPAFRLQPRIRFRTDFEREDDGRILMIWQVQPDGRYWEDEDGYGASNDEEVRLYTHIDANGCFTEPFHLYNCGVVRFYSRDFEEGNRAQAAGDYETACACYRKAAEANIRPAQFNLAVCLMEGWGAEKNPQEAFRWFEKAAKQGQIEAMENLAVCLLNGIGTAKDEQEAAQWTRIAAKGGMVQSMYNLGVLYEQGRFMKQDYARALEWYHKASEAGFAPADLAIGAAHAEGRGVPADYTEAVKWYEKAALAGVAKAQFNLGACHTMGLGVEQNHENAVYWYRKAVAQDYPDACFNLAACYLRGDGVEQDYEESARLLTRAAEMGLPNAQKSLALYYYNGIGVEKDIEKFRYWQERARNNGAI